MSQTYHSSHYALIAAVENSHFWFRARNQLLRGIFLGVLKKGTTFLEIGCGTGIIVRLLESLGMRVTGLDVNEKAITYARVGSHARFIRQSIYSYKRKEQFDAVGAFDVLEHQSQDLTFIRTCYQLTKPGGMLFLTVPAGMWLWTDIDEDSGHKRRYEPNDIREKVEASGFRVIAWNYWNVLPLPLFFFWRKAYFKTDRHDPLKVYLKNPPAVVNWIMEHVLELETVLGRFITWPIGSSLVLVAQKPL